MNGYIFMLLMGVVFWRTFDLTTAVFPDPYIPVVYQIPGESAPRIEYVPNPAVKMKLRERLGF